MGANGIPAELPEAELEQVKLTFKVKGRRVALIKTTPIEDDDFRRLRPGRWLNDELINAYMILIQARADRPARSTDIGFRTAPLRLIEINRNIFCFGTFFFHRLVRHGYQEAKLSSWTKNVNIFSLDRILLPINHFNNHWTAASINFTRKRIESFDSLEDSNHGRVFKFLCQYLDAEHRDKRFEPFNFSGWINYTHPMQPLQSNGCDCGVFTLVTLDALARGEDDLLFDQSNMAYFRMRIGWEILNGTLKTYG
ncbi:hypothetical protein CPB83DRAFT_775620 [Crepidotus variabilis]|uniref:Ubiquitin-like protease family profile domain-containing protein n=1 Tax=Crepidotus variabilis TaxID=179855 RepID=A0A9P6E6E6_9AGAR|nr:hypothetical protein CPB83DRAFT_775620 [Crepidotus variabilis]